jgi:hypothetical protein
MKRPNNTSLVTEKIQQERPAYLAYRLNQFIAAYLRGEYERRPAMQRIA